MDEGRMLGGLPRDTRMFYVVVRHVQWLAKIHLGQGEAMRQQSVRSNRNDELEIQMRQRRPNACFSLDDRDCGLDAREAVAFVS